MTTQYFTQLPDLLTPAQRQQIDRAARELRIEPVSVRWWHIFEGWIMPKRRVHDDFFFIPMTHHLDYVVGLESGRALAGQCLFVPVGVEHQMTMPTRCREMSIVAIHAELTPQWSGPLSQLFTGARHDLPDAETTRAKLERVIHMMEMSAEAGKVMAESMLRDWITTWALKQTQPDRAHGVQTDPRIGRALEIIRERYEGALSVSELAKSVGLAEARFRKLFTDAVGVGPKAYLVELRLRQAAQRLTLGTLSIKEIAHGSGFSDTHYFHQAFRNRFGCPPGIFRKQHRQSI